MKKLLYLLLLAQSAFVGMQAAPLDPEFVKANIARWLVQGKAVMRTFCTGPSHSFVRVIFDCMPEEDRPYVASLSFDYYSSDDCVLVELLGRYGVKVTRSDGKIHLIKSSDGSRYEAFRLDDSDAIYSMPDAQDPEVLAVERFGWGKDVAGLGQQGFNSDPSFIASNIARWVAIVKTIVQFQDYGRKTNLVRLSELQNIPQEDKPYIGSIALGANGLPLSDLVAARGIVFPQIPQIIHCGECYGNRMMVSYKVKFTMPRPDQQSDLIKS